MSKLIDAWHSRLRIGLVASVLLAIPAAAEIKDLLEMSEKLDNIDKQDFGDAIDKADRCTQGRDFACTNAWLAKASKLANGPRDRQRLAVAQKNMDNEKARIAEEQRRIAEAEERLRIAEAEAARRASESSDSSTGAQLFQLGMAIAGNVYGEKARLATAAAKSARSASGGLPLADLSSQRQALEKAKADAAAAQRARAQASAATPSYPPPQLYVSERRESCPPGFSPVGSASGSGSACVADAPAGARPSSPGGSPVASGASVGATARAASAPPNGFSNPGSPKTTNGLPPPTAKQGQPSVQPPASPAVAKADDSWQVCGPEKWCSAGDGYLQFCAGPPSGNPANRCKSECVMSSGVFYHDTALAKDVAYIPSREGCKYPCDVRNSCS